MEWLGLLGSWWSRSWWWSRWWSWSRSALPPPLNTLLMLDTLGALSLEQRPSWEHENNISVLLFNNPWIQYLHQSLSDLPAEDAWIILLIFLDLVFHFRCSNTWLAATNYSGSDTSGLLVSNHRIRITDIKLYLIINWQKDYQLSHVENSKNRRF